MSEIKFAVGKSEDNFVVDLRLPIEIEDVGTIKVNIFVHKFKHESKITAHSSFAYLEGKLNTVITL
jgi:hypothetical protein